MTCQKCGGHNLYVVDSRPGWSGVGYRRRRECADCGERITTYEVTQKEYSIVLQSKRFLKQVQKMLEKYNEETKPFEDAAEYSD